MRLLNTLAALLLALLLSAQSYTLHHKKYRNKFSYTPLGTEQVLRTWYHYVVSRTEDGRFILRIFYPETGLLTQRTTYTDEALQLRDGAAVRYYDNGMLRDSGAYAKGEPTGAWVKGDHVGWREDGSLDAKGRQGLWTERARTGWKRSEFTFMDDVKHGPYVLYDSLGMVKRSGTYAHGKLVPDSAAVASDTTTVTLLEEIPHLTVCAGERTGDLRTRCTEAHIMQHLRENLRYPPGAMKLGISGQALFQFVVDKDGSVVGITTLSGLCREIETECRRVLGMLPAWRPGIQRGKAVKTQYGQPVRFTLR